MLTERGERLLNQPIRVLLLGGPACGRVATYPRFRDVIRVTIAPIRLVAYEDASPVTISALPEYRDYEYRHTGRLPDGTSIFELFEAPGLLFGAMSRSVLMAGHSHGVCPSGDPCLHHLFERATERFVEEMNRDLDARIISSLTEYDPATPAALWQQQSTPLTIEVLNEAIREFDSEAFRRERENRFVPPPPPEPNPYERYFYPPDWRSLGVDAARRWWADLPDRLRDPAHAPSFGDEFSMSFERMTDEAEAEMKAWDDMIAGIKDRKPKRQET